MRFQPRFEVGAAGERLFKQATQTSPEVVNFLRKYIDEAKKESFQKQELPRRRWLKF